MFVIQWEFLSCMGWIVTWERQVTWAVWSYMGWIVTFCITVTLSREELASHKMKWFMHKISALNSKYQFLTNYLHSYVPCFILLMKFDFFYWVLCHCLIVVDQVTKASTHFILLFVNPCHFHCVDFIGKLLEAWTYWYNVSL